MQLRRFAPCRVIIRWCVIFSFCFCVWDMPAKASTVQPLSPQVQEQAYEKPRRGIKDVYKDHRLEKAAQQEHRKQRLRHNQLKEQCVFICCRRGVRSVAKAGAGGAPIWRRSWQTYEWQKVSQTSAVPPLCLFFFPVWNTSRQQPSLSPFSDGDPAETGWRIQMKTLVRSV